ncbi:MAG: NAD(P)-dependent oxidoreductase [Bacteroidota bacterium]
MLNNKPIIVITGASGFIGSYLVNYFLESNYCVRGLYHNYPEKKSNTNFEAFQFNLSSEINPNHFENADYVVHCAWENYNGNESSNENNINGTLMLRNYCREMGIKKFVFLSSMSAHENSLSNYGKTKHILESQFENLNELVIKPGLVLGNGGLFSKIDFFIKKHSIIPLIDGGHQSLQTLLIHDLAKAIQIGIEKDLNGLLLLSEIEPIEIRNLYSTLAEIYHKKIIFVNISFSIVKLVFQLIKFSSIPFNLSLENLLGLKQLRSLDVRNDLKVFRLTPKTYKESLYILKANESVKKH